MREVDNLHDWLDGQLVYFYGEMPSEEEKRRAKVHNASVRRNIEDLDYIRVLVASNRLADATSELEKASFTRDPETVRKVYELTPLMGAAS